MKKGLSSTVVVVEIIFDDGRIRGYGEGIPDKRVTGETPESAIANACRFIKSNLFPWTVTTPEQIWRLVDALPRGKENDASICAIETALLDSLGKSQDKSILEYFPDHYYRDTVRYGAAITIGSRARVRELCDMIHDLGIKDLRIKMGADLDQNQFAIECAIYVFGEDCELRIDPNGIWELDTAFAHIPLIRDHHIKVVEEPMPKSRPGFRDFVEALRSMGVMLMACESAPTLAHVETVVSVGYYQMVNVKLSRSGGFRRSLKIIDYLREAGLQFQIGCTLGESGILSAAGRALCLLCGDALYCDGSFDALLLKRNVTSDPVSFGYGGEAGPLNGPGLGVSVSRDNIERLCDPSATISISRPNENVIF